MKVRLTLVDQLHLPKHTRRDLIVELGYLCSCRRDELLDRLELLRIGVPCRQRFRNQGQALLLQLVALELHIGAYNPARFGTMMTAENLDGLTIGSVRELKLREAFKKCPNVRHESPRFQPIRIHGNVDDGVVWIPTDDAVAFQQASDR